MQITLISIGQHRGQAGFLYQRAGILHRFHSGRLGSTAGERVSHPRRKNRPYRKPITCHDPLSPGGCRENLQSPGPYWPLSPAPIAKLTTAQALRRAGIEPEIHMIRNLTAADLEASVSEMERAIRNSQMIITARRLLRRRRTGRLRKIHLRLLPQSPHHRSRARFALSPRRPDAGHLQRFSRPF